MSEPSAKARKDVHLHLISFNITFDQSLGMQHSFKARILKIGINPYVSVPKKITAAMKPVRGYIPVKGKIEDYPFVQTLVPVKNSSHRLFVNGPMLKNTGLAVGKVAHFIVEQDFIPREKAYPMSGLFRNRLKETMLLEAFQSLTPYRKLEILRYLNQLKTDDARNRNIEKVVSMLKEKTNS